MNDMTPRHLPRPPLGQNLDSVATYVLMAVPVSIGLPAACVDPADASVMNVPGSVVVMPKGDAAY
jgi:hypothetical protein